MSAVSALVSSSNETHRRRDVAKVSCWWPQGARYTRWFIAAACLLPLSAAAQQQQPTEWAKLPRMQLERQFAGPLQDTIIQRWRDPVDGTICYIYLPIMAVHSAPAASGYVQYGANTIGSISCITAAAARSSTPAPKGSAAPVPSPGPPAPLPPPPDAPARR
jgi:hypothetical protein